MPVSKSTLVDVVFRCGETDENWSAGSYDAGDSWWEHKGEDIDDIIAYRVIGETSNEA
jgi:hypothetical protein